jgi:alkanesulfonate monooxygenase SsuD/methylene tetrahydromethanopterin reductase-like flavin-dependent oxidoreductase (luciferase family)
MRGRAFVPAEVAVARAFYVAKDKADKEAALEQRLAAQRHFAALSKAADGTQSKASIMAFSDTREASEEAALYGTPDEIALKLERLQKLGADYVLLNGGGLAHESLRRFARELMPAFADDARMRDVG